MRKVIFILCIMVSMVLGSTPVIASVSDDQVTSQKIREADGTSGQNTNSGSGVKTGHIQDSAVTGSKIANGAVTDAKITGPISGSKLGAHTHSGSDITDSTVTTTKIQDGAVTDAKITGPISGSKISSTGLNADTVDGQHASAFAPATHIHSMASVSGLQASLAGKSDVTHNHDTLYQQKYGKVAVVAQTGGDYANVVTAMNDIATWCGSPSASNPCLLKLMPGVYDLAGWLTVPSYVDIEGSGQQVTKTRGGTFVFMPGNTNNELRNLTIEMDGTDNFTSGGLYVVYINGCSPQLKDITLHLIGFKAGYAHYGFNILGSASPTIKNVKISTTGPNFGGILALIHSEATPQFEDLTIETLDRSVVGGWYFPIHFNGASATIKNLKIVGFDFSNVYFSSIYSQGPPQSLNPIRIFDSFVGRVRLSNTSKIVGANIQIDEAQACVGCFKCINCFDSNFNTISFP